MGVNIPENISEGNSFENAMNNSKSTGNTIGVDKITKDQIRQRIIDTSSTISSDK